MMLNTKLTMPVTEAGEKGEKGDGGNHVSLRNAQAGRVPRQLGYFGHPQNASYERRVVRLIIVAPQFGQSGAAKKRGQVYFLAVGKRT